MNTAKERAEFSIDHLQWSLEEIEEEIDLCRELCFKAVKAEKKNDKKRGGGDTK